MRTSFDPRIKMLLLNCFVHTHSGSRSLPRLKSNDEAGVHRFDVWSILWDRLRAQRQSSRERVTARRLSKHTLKIWKRNGTGLWPDLHVTAAHHISGFSAPVPISLPYFGATRRIGDGYAWRVLSGIIGGSRRVREDRGKTESSNGRRAEEKRWDGRYVSTEYAGTLTPPDYPMNRNVIYGSFSELEDWRESRADRAIVHNASRHIAIPKLILSANTILLCMILLLLRGYIYYMNVFTVYLTQPIMLHRAPSTSVIWEFYHDEGSNVHSVSSAIFITRDTGARFRYAAYACVCVRR